jgi:hypothetical protein
VILEVPSTGLRGMRKHTRASLLTLTPTFPSRPDSIRSDLPAGLSLLGLSKDRPSIVPNRRVRRPGARVATVPFGGRRPVSPACRPRGFSPPRRIFLSDRAGLFHPAADHGVRRVSSRRETGLLTAHFLPFEVFPPPIATDPERVRLRGPASRVRPLLTAPFTACLASSPFPPVRVSVVSHRDGSESGPRGLAPSSGPLPPRPFQAAAARYSLGLVRSRRPPRPHPVPSPFGAGPGAMHVPARPARTSKTAPRSSSSVRPPGSN